MPLTSESVWELAKTGREREYFSWEFYLAVVRSEPTDRLELKCLLLGVTPDALRRIRELAEAGTIPAYRRLKGQF